MGEEEIGIGFREKIMTRLKRLGGEKEQKGAKEIVTPAQALNNLIKRLEKSDLEVVKRTGWDLKFDLEALLRELREARTVNPALTIKQFLMENKRQGEDQPHSIKRGFEDLYWRVKDGTWVDPQELAEVLGLQKRDWDAVRKHIGWFTDRYRDFLVDMPDGSKVTVKEGIAHLARESEEAAGACLRVKQPEDRAFPVAWALEIPQTTVIEYLDAKVSGAPSQP